MPVSYTHLYEGMILRLDGKDRNIGTVTYDAKTQKINVYRGTTPVSYTHLAANFFAIFNICESGDHIVASSSTTAKG